MTVPDVIDPDRAVRDLGKADPKLKALMKQAGPCELKPRPHWSPYEAIARSICYQQLAGPAARTIYGRFARLWDPNVEDDPEVGVPRPPIPELVAGAPTDQLRLAGLSGSKAAALQDLATKALDGIVPMKQAELAKLSDEDIVNRLTMVRGVGPWTVHMFLMFFLARPDVLPTADYGVRKGYSVVYGLHEPPSEKELAELTEHWRPWRSVASWYMWRALEL
jgi:DNA-3-methyladenine glycosylase II